MNKNWVFSGIIIGLVILLLAAAGCGKSTTTTSTTTTATTTAPAQTPPPVSVVSVLGPLSPINPGGPVVSIDLMNVSSKTIYSLAATLTLNKPFDFAFSVSASGPLPPNNSISAKQTLIGGSISSGTAYDLKISGTYQDGGTFSFNQSVTVAAPAATTTPTGSPTPPVSNQNSSSVTSANGLSLNLSLESTSYHPGDQVKIMVEEKNSLAAENRVAAAANWTIQGLIDGPCGTLNYPFGVAVLKGNYDLSSISSAAPLKLYNPALVYSCPLILAGITFYDFQASSNVAAIVSGGTNPTPSTSMTAQIITSGSWSGGPDWVFSNFDPGVYTVVAGDEWGQVTILHFTVS